MPVEREHVKIAASAALVVAAAVGIYLPGHFSRADLAHREQQAEAELSGGRTSGPELLRLTNDVQHMRTLTSQPQRYVPQEDELAEAIRGLTESLAESGASVQEIVVNDAKHFRDYSVIPVTVKFTASFPSAFAVFTNIEAMPRLVRFDDVQMVGDEKDPGSPVTVDLALSAFYSPAASGEGSGR